jgi:hypothetical protein
MSSRALLHLKHLALTIGPRGSTTAGERAAAEYARTTFEAAGLETHWEPFRAPVSGWRPFAIASLAGLGSLLVAQLFATSGAIVAALIMAAATLSVFQEMYFRPNLLRPFVPKGASQNVWARIPAQRAAKRRLLLVGHIDTHRTPWLFTSPLRLKLLRLITSLGVVGFLAGTLLFALLAAGLTALTPWTLLLAPIYLVVLLATVQPDLTPHTQGANDNASGVAVVMSLAERLAREPLADTEVWALASGCEEVGSYGTQAFCDRRREALPGLMGISIDNVGGAGAGVCFTSVEGMVFPLKPDALLFALAEEIAREQPELNGYSLPYTTLHTDATTLMTRGVRSLSFVGLTPDGTLPNWHTVGDTFERVDPGSVERTEAFVWGLLQRLDRTLSGGVSAPHRGG